MTTATSAAEDLSTETFTFQKSAGRTTHRRGHPIDADRTGQRQRANARVLRERGRQTVGRSTVGRDHGSARCGEPADHPLGRSRGGLSTKVHLASDGRARPLAFTVTAGQAGDAPAFETVMSRIRVPRRGPGRPRTQPVAVLADRAYPWLTSPDTATLGASGAIFAAPRDRT